MPIKPVITEESLLGFKSSTKENEKVIGILKNQLSNYLFSPILDVGAGIGDIALEGFPDKEAILVDRLNFAEYSHSKKHKRILADFFNIYKQHENLSGTVIYSHVLQYLDNDYDELVKATELIAPKTIFTVTNCNDGEMKKIVDWSIDNIPDANPEIDLATFPVCCGYKLVKKIPFSVEATESNFHDLAVLVAYLIDSSKEKYLQRIENFLKEVLRTPTFSINQEIKVYERVKGDE